MSRDRDDWQGARYRPGQRQGHYESWFLRGNHPTRREAFWVRYTIFAPAGRPIAATGELWAIHFDGERGRIRVAKQDVPLSDCAFAATGLDVRIGQAWLRPGRLQGEARGPQHIAWNLEYDGGGAALLLLPKNAYDGALPRAKAVTPRPLVRFRGDLQVDGETVAIDDWVGSENHNWGSRHTDTYAWGQVAGFDEAPDAFLEVITARLKFGPLWTPKLSGLVLRLGGEEYRLNHLLLGAFARAGWRGFDWRFDIAQRGLRVTGHIHARREDFIGLSYRNPPGGSHTCLNSKLASCELTLALPGQAPRRLRSAHRAAFEILTDDTAHGVPLAV